ncbi:hypothetical protein E2C01_080106 [Portunus trituberculatus]|uniref:Uncharacterized protein n=1 Tax=Portunus trituberculatus TaxID=210409 RepID=A0A5B7IUJ6_PORTR|nr:hypothetical protein [Portunus trituberculatus]
MEQSSFFKLLWAEGGNRGLKLLHRLPLLCYETILEEKKEGEEDQYCPSTYTSYCTRAPHLRCCMHATQTVLDTKLAVSAPPSKPPPQAPGTPVPTSLTVTVKQKSISPRQ